MLFDKQIDLFQNILDAVISTAEKSNDGSLMYRRLVNGYRLFDLSRGLDYTLDIGFRDLETGKELIKRYKACKPLGNVEILSVPYVTENGRVTILVSVRETEIQTADEFLKMYTKNFIGDHRQKTFLMFVLVYEAESPSKGDTDVFKELKKMATKATSKCKHGETCKVAWLSVRLPMYKDSSQVNEEALKLALVDLGLRKIGTDSLVLVLNTKVEINGDFLNRVSYIFSIYGVVINVLTVIMCSGTDEYYFWVSNIQSSSISFI